MSVAKTRPRKTVEDFMSLGEGVRAELIDGEILMSPSPRRQHQEVLLYLVRRLADHVDANQLGKVFVAPFDVHLPSGDVVEPDVIYVAATNLGIVKEWIYGVPDLVVEVLSPDGIERDRFVKRELYARNGIGEYWIVDSESRSVEVLSLQGHQYEPLAYFEENERLSSPLLPGFTLPLNDLFA